MLACALAASCYLSSSHADPMGSGTAYKGWRVSDLHIIGVDSDTADELLKGLALAGSRSLFRVKRPDFSPTILEADLDRVQLHVARHGYPFATASPRFEADSRNRSVSITFDVDLGPPILIRDITVDGAPEHLRSACRTAIGIPPDGTFVDEEVNAASDRLVDLLKRSGHADAAVAVDVRRSGQHIVDIRYRVVPGPVYTFAGIRVEGIGNDLVPLVERLVALPIGVRYTPDVPDAAAGRLRRVGLFRQIRLETEPSGPDGLILVCRLAERSHRTLFAGVGYWSDERFRAHSSWEHRNLLARGRGFAARAGYSIFLQTASASLWQPALLSPHIRGDLSLRGRRENEDAYDVRSGEIEVGILRALAGSSSLRLSLSSSYVDIRLKAEELTRTLDEIVGALTIAKLAWTRDTTKDRLFPRHGVRTRLAVEWTPPSIGSATHFIRTDVGVAFHRPIGNDLVLATRLRTGLAAPAHGAESLIPHKRFFAGGSSSMRGFKRRQLGPLDEAERALGGETLLEGAAEIRFPLMGRLKGALFVDAGQVWARREIKPDELEVAVGPGLIMLTVIGPVRTDLGIRLTDRSDTQPRVVFHISIGHPF